MDILLMLAEEATTIALTLVAWAAFAVALAFGWVIVRAIVDAFLGRDRLI